MTLADLAWADFAFAQMNGHDPLYQEIVGDQELLGRLQTHPTIEDFERLRHFLTQYGVHFAPKDLASQYLSVWPKVRGYVAELSVESLIGCDFGKASTRKAIRSLYSYLWGPAVWGGDTVVSKMLHFFNVSLFVMSDIQIGYAYGGFGPDAYVSYLQAMQTLACQVIQEYSRLDLAASLEE